MRAFLKNNRQAPRKVRLIARSIVGKNVAVAVSELSFMPHKAAQTLKKIILSAVANAKQKNDAIKEEDLIVKNIQVDKGTTYVRYMPRAFGRATPINRENSHIRVELAPIKEAIAPVGKVEKLKTEKVEKTKNTTVTKKTEEKKNTKTGKAVKKIENTKNSKLKTTAKAGQANNKNS